MMEKKWFELSSEEKIAHWDRSEDLLLQILHRLEPQLPAKDVQQAREFVEHNEHGLALELILATLAECDIARDHDVTPLIEEAAAHMGIGN